MSVNSRYLFQIWIYGRRSWHGNGNGVRTKQLKLVQLKIVYVQIKLLDKQWCTQRILNLIS